MRTHMFVKTLGGYPVLNSLDLVKSSETTSQEGLDTMPDSELLARVRQFKHSKRLRWKQRTAETYNSILGLFCQFAEEASFPPSIELVIDWLELVKATNSPSTVHSYWAHLRTFLNYCERIGAIPAADNPARLLVDMEMAPQAPELSPTSFTDNELVRLLDHLATVAAGDLKRDKRAIRDYCIILFAYVTGVRANEIVKLQKRDIDLEKGQVLIRRHTSKSNKDHYVSIDEDTIAAMLAYWQSRPKKAKWTKEFFVSYGGRVGKGKPLSRDALNQMLRRRCHDAGIEARKFHALRHSSALAALDAGLPIHYVRDQLGHKSLETTQLYTRTRNKDQLTAYQNARLGSRLTGKKPDTD